MMPRSDDHTPRRDSGLGLPGGFAGLQFANPYFGGFRNSADAISKGRPG